MFLSNRSVQLGLVSLLVASACGARSEVGQREIPDALTVEDSDSGVDVEAECVEDEECALEDLCLPRECVAGVCVDLPEILCNDDDACTQDVCDAETGECVFAPRTFDEDGDGHRAPLPGFAPGAAGSCGDDCDDTSALAFPGGTELCDGVDNDCNGSVDDDFDVSRPSRDPLLVSTMSEEAGIGGLTHNGDLFGVSFASRVTNNQVQFAGISTPQAIEITPVDIPRVNNDTFAGPLIWNGSVFAVVWEDRRDQDFEIYFNRLDSMGRKLGPDLRVSNAPGFSLRPDVLFNGQEYLVAWGDRRGGRDDFRIYGQRISRDGDLLPQGNVILTPDVSNAESPSLAEGTTGLGLLFNAPIDDERRVIFRSVSNDFQELGEPIAISAPGGVGASLIHNGDTFVAAWSERNTFPGDAIWGAVLSETGDVLVPARRLTVPAQFARGHSILPLGDRLMLFWSEFHDGGSYDVFYRFLSPLLEPLTDARPVTELDGDILSPVAALGKDGEVGILYTDRSLGSPQVFFTSLSCQ